MDHATQVALTRRLLGLLDQRTTEMAPAPYPNPASVYTSPTQFDRERALLFGREPLLVGLSCDVAAPGAYFAHTDCGVPILVVRAKSGRLNAFLDVCRHRGAQVVSGAGTNSTGRFTCPYHGWTYDDDGKLVGQPCREGFDGVPRESLGLTPLPVAERYGLLFVRPSPGEPIEVDTQLGGAQHELAPFCLERYVRFARHEIERALNWKIAVETFLEAYHVPNLHRQTLGPSILGEPAVWDAFGRSARLVAVRSTITALRDRPEAEWNLLDHAVVLYHLFPNAVLIHQIDHVELVQVYPGSRGVDSAKIVFSLYTPEAATSDGARRHFQANWELLLRTVENEDFQIGEQMQRGFHAEGHAGVVYGRNEPGVAHFERMIAAAIGATAPSSDRAPTSRPRGAARR